MDEREVELIDYLRVLWRQKWVIIITVVAAVVAAWGTSRAISPVYRTETSLLLLPPLSSQLDAEAVGSRLAPEAYEELAVSTSLLRMVSEALEPRVSVSAGSLKSRLSVSVKRLSSEGELLLSASIRGANPDRLPVIAEAWTASFAETYGELFQDRNARSYDYVSENYAETEAELEALVEKRTAFLDDHPLVILRADADALEVTLASNNREILKAKQELETAKAYLAAREGNRASQLPTYVLTSDVDPTTLAGALAYGLSPSEYEALAEARIKDLEQTTASIIEDLAAKQREINAAEAALAELDRKISLLEQAYASLAAKLQEAKIALAETPEPIRVIDEPLVPRSPIAPKRTSNIAIAGFLGLIVGTLLAFFVDYLARVRKQERATRLAATPGSETPRDRNADQKAQSPSEENRPNP